MMASRRQGQTIPHRLHQLLTRQASSKDFSSSSYCLLLAANLKLTKRNSQQASRSYSIVPRRFDLNVLCLKHNHSVTNIRKSDLLCSCLPYTEAIRSYPRGSRDLRQLPLSDTTVSHGHSDNRFTFDDIGESLRALELGSSERQSGQSRDSESRYLRDERQSKSERELEHSRDVLSRSVRDTESKSFRNAQPETVVSDTEPSEIDIVQNDSLPRRFGDVDERYLDARDEPNDDLSLDVTSLSLPELARYASNIAPFVNQVPCLQKMVQLGVNLNIVQMYEGLGAHLLRSNFEKNIAPFVRFLVDIGVPMDKVGKVLTYNPYILTSDGTELEKRVGYLIHKKFTLPEVGSMVTRCPMLLLMTPERLDNKLGTLQQSFRLTGAEVRKVAVNYPKILPYKRRLIAVTKFLVKESLGFTDPQMKTIILKTPKVFMANRKQLVANMDYLHNTMLIPHEQVIIFPLCLVKNSENLKNRHLFLLSRGRAQYDPCEARYVSLQALTHTDDVTFCRDTAKCELQDLYDFAKTF